MPKDIGDGIVGWCVRVTTDETYDEVYNSVLYLAGFADPDQALRAVQRIRSRAGDSYEVLPDAITAGRGPQPERGEVRLIEGAV